MSRRIALLLSVFAVPAAAQDAAPQLLAATASPAPSPVSVLIRQGQRWLDQGRPELAALSVQRALSAEPRNPEFLLLGLRIESVRNNREAAAAYAARLRGTDATAEQVAIADSEVRAASLDRAAIEVARRLSREAKPEEAASAYRAAFGQREPPSAYAREYYQALAATAAGREAGQRALGQLAAQPNADDRTLLANAEQLTFTTATRAEGIRRLGELAGKSGVSAEAQRAWKQALGFYENDAAAAPLYEGFLRRYPADADVRRRLETARAAPASTSARPGDDLRRRGFEELESGGLRGSGQRFQDAIALDPKDADSLGGLGVVRLRESKPAEARGLLERAIAADPAKAGQWRRALDGANYTLELAEARTLLHRGDGAGADTILRRAVRRDVEDPTDAEIMLGETAQQRGDAAEAEQHFRAALVRRPNFGPSVTGLSQALRKQGRVAEANALRPPAPPPSPVSEGGSANPQVARLRADASRSADPASEAGLLNAALAISPNDPWLRLDLARALRRIGRDAEGRALVEELAARAPTADASYAAALLSQESGRPADAEAFLSRIAPQRRTADMARLQARVRNQTEVVRAVALLSSAPADARRRLLLLAARPDPTGGTPSDAIRALGDAADAAGAAEAGRVAESINRDAPARIAIAGALLAAGLDQEAAALAARAEEGPLTPGQRRDLAGLRTSTAVRASDRLNESGDQASAYERLRPELSSSPGNAAVELALARLYQGARRPADAQRIAEAVLARSPRDADARRGAVEAAIEAGDRRRAEALANEARALSPGESRATFLQARVARANGNDARARALLEEAAAQRDQELGQDRPITRVGLAGSQGPTNLFGRAGANAPPATLVVSSDRVSREISQELALVRAETAPRVSASAIVRVRSGTAGLDSLTELATSVEARVSPGSFPGRLIARVTPVFLDSGRHPTSGDPALRFGTNALGATAPSTSPAGTATGLGLNVAYQRGEVFAMDIGTSPLGFRTTNLLGGIEVAPRLTENVRLRLKGERRSVLDSLLSYAGERDPVTGQTWGGVTQTGGRVQLEAGIGAGSAYVLGGYAILDGDKVVRNNRAEAGAGFSFPLIKQPDSELTAGLDLVYFGYDNNQRGFTFGQGGYFSPQRFTAVNLPVEYRSRIGDLRYKLGGMIGYARFREDASALFPNNPFLQSQAEAANRVNPLIPTRNQSQTKNGVIGGVRIELDYPLTDTLSLAGSMRYDKAADFQETRVSVRLESRF